MSKTIEELEIEIKSLSNKNKALESKLDKADKMEEEFKALNKRVSDYELQIKTSLEKENSYQKNQIFKNLNIDPKFSDMVSKLTKDIEISALENELKKDEYKLFRSKENMLNVEIVDDEEKQEAKVNVENKYVPLENKLESYLKKFS